MIVYVAGRITGQFDFMKRFRKAERYLKAQGHIVINPARLPQGLKNYMPACKALIDQSEAVYFLCDWAESEGATEEHVYAVGAGKILIYEQAPLSADTSELEFWRKQALELKKEAVGLRNELEKLKSNLKIVIEKASVSRRKAGTANDSSKS